MPLRPKRRCRPGVLGMMSVADGDGGDWLRGDHVSEWALAADGSSIPPAPLAAPDPIIPPVVTEALGFKKPPLPPAREEEKGESDGRE